MKRCGVDWSDDEWLDEARRIRRALAALGDYLPPCLPNEPGARGQSTRSHYASYYAQHKARAQLRIERDLPHPDPRITGTVVDDSHLVRMRTRIRWHQAGQLGSCRWLLRLAFRGCG